MGEIITVISDLVSACLLSENNNNNNNKEINTLACNLEESTIGFDIYTILLWFCHSLKAKKIEIKQILTDHKVTTKYDVKCELP